MLTKVQKLELALDAAKRAERGSQVTDVKILRSIEAAGFCVFAEETGKPYGYTKGTANHVQSVSDGVFQVDGNRYYGQKLGGWMRIFKMPKSDACSMVLQLMDKDFAYLDAVRIALALHSEETESGLCQELEQYI